jgi:hypothetical protein
VRRIEEAGARDRLVVEAGAVMLGQLDELGFVQAREQQAQLLLLRLVEDAGDVASGLAGAEDGFVEADARRALQVEREVVVHRERIEDLGPRGKVRAIESLPADPSS